MQYKVPSYSEFIESCGFGKVDEGKNTDVGRHYYQLMHNVRSDALVAGQRIMHERSAKEALQKGIVLDPPVYTTYVSSVS